MYFNMLAMPAVWGGILTITTIAIGIVLKQLVGHAFAAPLEKIKRIKDMQGKAFCAIPRRGTQNLF